MWWFCFAIFGVSRRSRTHAAVVRLTQPVTTSELKAVAERDLKSSEAASGSGCVVAVAAVDDVDVDVGEYACAASMCVCEFVLRTRISKCSLFDYTTLIDLIYILVQLLFI